MTAAQLSRNAGAPTTMSAPRRRPREEPSLDSSARLPGGLAGNSVLAAEAADLRFPAVLTLPRVEPESALVQRPPMTLPGAALVTHSVSPDTPALRVIHIKQTHGVSAESVHDKILRDAQMMSREELAADSAIREILADAYRPRRWPSGALVESTPTFRRNAELFREVLLDEVDEWQRSILQTLQFLGERHGITSVYAEGVALDNYDAVRAKMDDARASHVRISAGIAAANESAARLRTSDPAGGPALVYYERQAAELEQAAQSLNQSWGEEAVFRLHRRGSVAEILPSETFEAHQAVVAATRAGRDRVREQSVRESIAVRLISDLERRGDGVAVLVYGADHSFRDNIEAWNARHPKRQIALTEVTPRTTITPEMTERRALERIRERAQEAAGR